MNTRNRFLTLISAILALSMLFTAGAAAAEQQVIKGEHYRPGVWVDPDGCEHWVLDDGWEGYMTPHVSRDGIPVCRRGPACGTFPSDQLFTTDSHNLNADSVARLRQFFRTSPSRAVIIVGHTDSRASDAYNLALSQRRADAVAQVARAAGLRVVDVRGYGERLPVASNRTNAGMAKNRRVEIICLR
ncbi:OmpA family protein [Actibacterium sp. XHP0104]|uniref:OmpA family protein n=1 Tax=Actibacterium sp. XHP0104 TaxID=2984335 RepID=UPI0021E97A3A|nr:OmpA family protein [Actibacterium sp. XHP0104]MCV2882195.1 OmpA family protein [Actibacterium sp. XHP0104]